MVAAGLPLLGHNDEEQRGHRKVDARRVKRQHTAQQCTRHAARDPVKLVQQRHPEIVFFPVHALGHAAAAHDGIGLIGQRKNQVRLGRAGVFIAFQHRNSVKQMPRVDHQCHDRRRDQRRAARQQVNCDILHTARVDQPAHDQCPPRAVALALQEHTKAQPQHDIPRHDGQGPHKGVTNRFHFSFPL